MKLRNFSLLLFCCFFFTQLGMAQEITTNENGEKIIVYPDGSWKYAEDEATEPDTQRSLPDEVTQSDKDLEFAVQIAERAAAAEVAAIRNEEDAKYKRLLIEDELKEADGNDEYYEEEIKEIKIRLKAAKKVEKQAKSARKSAEKKAKEASDLVTMKPQALRKELRKYQEGNEESTVEEEPVGMFPGSITETEVEERKVVKVREPIPKSNKVFAKYNPEKNVLFNPPTTECQLSFDGMDEFSGKKRKDVKKQLFFTYTNEELRSIFRDKDYITCTGYLSSLSGGLKFLTLNITIASKTAQREYGILEKGGQINIKLLDGENVKLVNTKTSMGTENPLDDSVSYRAQYLVSSGDEKKLKRSEVDKVRIIWSSGYEDYEIYELDFFMDQFKCLD